MKTKYIIRIINALITLLTDETKPKTERYGMLVGVYIVHIIVAVVYGMWICPHLGTDSIVMLVNIVVALLIGASLYYITSEFIKANKKDGE